jgi:hypothetical protein
LLSRFSVDNQLELSLKSIRVIVKVERLLPALHVIKMEGNSDITRTHAVTATQKLLGPKHELLSSTLRPVTQSIMQHKRNDVSIMQIHGSGEDEGPEQEGNTTMNARPAHASLP